MNDRLSRSSEQPVLIKTKIKYFITEPHGKFDEDFDENVMIMEFKCKYFLLKVIIYYIDI
jgi:hypothetical protein